MSVSETCRLDRQASARPGQSTSLSPSRACRFAGAAVATTQHHRSRRSTLPTRMPVMGLRSLPLGPGGVVAPTGPRDAAHSLESKAALANKSKCPSYDARQSKSVRHEGIADLGWLDLRRHHAACARERPRCSFGQAARSAPPACLFASIAGSERAAARTARQTPFLSFPAVRNNVYLARQVRRTDAPAGTGTAPKPSPLRVPSLATLSLPGRLSSDPSSESQRLRASKIPHVSPSNLGDGAIPGGRHTRHQQRRPRSSSPGRATREAK